MNGEERKVTNPQISVIITVYNIDQYIGECIESVLKQSIKDIEVICVDDGSTDDSLKILNEYAYNDVRVKIIHNMKSAGPSTARNIGYRAAKGEYIYQIDGDDYIIEGALERMYTCAEKNKLDLLTFSARAFADTEEIKANVHNLLNLYIRNGSYSGVKSGIDLFAEFTHNGDFHGNLCCIFLNRKFFEDNNLYLLDGLFASADSPFLIYLKAQRAMCIQDALYVRRFRENSIVTSKKNLIKFESILLQFLYEIDLWKQYNFETAIEKELEKYFAINWRRVLKTYDDVTDKDSPIKLLQHNKGAKFIYNNFFKKSNIYWSKLTDKIIDEIKTYDHVIIYGAKDVAKEVKRILDDCEVKHYMIAVSDNKNEKSFEGKKVYEIEELRDFKENAIVLIAVNKRHHKAINEKLSLIGFNDVLEIE